MVDSKPDNKIEVIVQCAPETAQSPAAASTSEKPSTPEPVITGKREMTEANRAFNFLNYFGLGFAANSALSLFISYNVLPTQTAQDGIRKLGNGLRTTANAWDNFKSMFNLGSKDKMRSELQREGKLALHEIEEQVTRKHEIHIGESARSMAEIITMCAAGTIILLPMKWMENHKIGIVDKLDHMMNKDLRKQEADTANNRNEVLADTQMPEDQVSWSRLLTARAVGVASVIGIDAAIQLFNNRRFDKGKGNADTAEWQLGNQLHDKLSPEGRDKLINFFSRKGASIEGIQPIVQKRLLKTIGAPDELLDITKRLFELRTKVAEHPEMQAASFFKRKEVRQKLYEEIAPERVTLLQQIEENPVFKEMTQRAVIAEQTRLLSKEISLTLVMAGLVYGMSKTPFVSIALEKCGLKKHKEAPSPAPAVCPPCETAPAQPEQEAPAKQYSATIKPREPLAIKPREKLAAPEALFAQKTARDQEAVLTH